MIGRTEVRLFLLILDRGKPNQIKSFFGPILLFGEEGKCMGICEGVDSRSEGSFVFSWLRITWLDLKLYLEEKEHQSLKRAIMMRFSP